MLSSQTKDEVTSSTMARLIDRGVANLTALRDIPEAELALLLQPVSFYRVIFIVSYFFTFILSFCCRCVKS